MVILAGVFPLRSFTQPGKTQHSYGLRQYVKSCHASFEINSACFKIRHSLNKFKRQGRHNLRRQTRPDGALYARRIKTELSKQNSRVAMLGECIGNT